METLCEKGRELYDKIIKKNDLKANVHYNTLEIFNMLRDCARETIRQMKECSVQNPGTYDPRFDFIERGEYEFEIKFSSDLLVFAMHTNVFEFSRDHEVMKTSYIKEDKTRSYCGVIQIFNFLADSFNYQRENDLGYMIGRLFINKDKHFFIEGKQELGMLYNNFNSSEITREACCELLRSAMNYTSDFDLLNPPYDEVKVVSVGWFQTELSAMKISTGKRLGFKFQADQ